MKGSIIFVVLAIATIVGVALVAPSAINAFNDLKDWINNGSAGAGSSVFGGAVILNYADGTSRKVTETAHTFLPLTVFDTSGKPVTSISYEFSAYIVSAEVPTQISLNGQSEVVLFGGQSNGITTDELATIRTDSLSVSGTSAEFPFSKENTINSGLKTISWTTIEAQLVARNLAKGRFSLHWDATVGATVTFADGTSYTKTGGGSNILTWEFDWQRSGQIITLEVIIAPVVIR